MKVYKLAFGFLSLLALASCSEDKVGEPQNPGGEVPDGNSRYMSVTIRNANGGRASANPGQQAGNLFEEGLTGENAISTLRFYFFDATGAPVPVTMNDKNYYDCSKIEEAGTNMPNVEKILKAVIVINTEKGDKLENLNKMVAVANITIPDGNKSLSELQEIIGSYNENEEKAFDKTTASMLKPMPMTSSVYGTGAYDCAAEILPSNICQSETAAKDHPVDIYIERISSKVRVSFAWEGGVAKETATYKEQTYTAVQLNNPTERDLTGKVIKSEPILVNGKKVYAIFTNWCPTGVAKQSYAFKKFDATWSQTLGWTTVGTKRSYWAENPFEDPAKGVVATTDACPLKYYNPAQAKGKYGSAPIATSSSNYDGSWYYIQENAGTKGKNGLKGTLTTDPGYDPATQLSNRTQVFLGAMLVTVENGVATPIELSEWGGTKYTDDGLISAMLNVVKTQIYLGRSTEKTVDGEKVIEWKFITLEPSDVELKSATDIFGDDYFDAQDDLRYLTYIQLKKDFAFPEGFEKKFYKSKNITGDNTEPEAYADAAAVNVVLRSTPGAKVWKSGMTYYYVDIEHEATAAETKGKYGVVRNHIYDIELNQVFGLGTPIYDPENNTVIIPEKPKDLDSFIGARINVLSWRVIRQGVTLDW